MDSPKTMCFICKAFFENWKAFNFHFKTYHADYLAAKKKIKCVTPECELFFSNLSNLRKHVVKSKCGPIQAESLKIVTTDETETVCKPSTSGTAHIPQEEVNVVTTDETEPICKPSTSGTAHIPQDEEKDMSWMEDYSDDYSSNISSGEPTVCQNLHVELHESDKDEESENEDEKMVTVDNILAENLDLHVNALATQLNGMGIPETHITSIIESVSNITDSIFETVNFYNVKRNVPEEVRYDLEETQSTLSKAFKRVQTKYMRKKLFSNMKFYVKPITVGIEADSSIVPKQKTFVYVPITETLRKILEVDQFFDDILKCKKAHTEGVNAHYQDCENFKKICDTEDIENTVLIQLYYDDFEIAKQSRKNKHKLGAVYFTIKNLSEAISSKLENIFLVALFNVHDVKNKNSDFALNNVFEPLVKEMIQLSSVGIRVNNRTIKALVVSFCFDNLGGNEIFGITKCFFRTAFCRFCIFTMNEFHELFHERDCKLRTTENHEQDIENKTNGVTHRTFLYDLPNFNLFEACTVDCMHDILEGACSFTMKAFLEAAMKDDREIIPKVNERINHFQYGENFVKDKPCPIVLEKSNLGQHAAQCWSLFLHFPLLLNGLTPQNSKKNMDIIIQLLDIMSIVFAPSITNAQIEKLEGYISEYLKSCVKNFGKIKPKQHFLVHYPNVIRRLGPPVTYWTMRYEAKHRFFIQIGKKISSFKSICLTLSQRHQESVAKTGLINTIESLKGKSKQINTNELSCREIVVEFIDIDPLCPFYKYSWIKKNFKYKAHTFLCYKKNENDLPKFVEILDIFSHKNEIYFGVVYWESICFDKSIYAYNVKKTEVLGVMKLFEVEHYPHTFDLYSHNMKNYIISKFRL